MSSPIRVIFFDLGETLVHGRTWLPGAKAALAALTAGGFRLGVISNTGDLEDRAAILALLPADFDLGAFEPGLVLFSSEVKIEKPDRAIFEKAVAAANVPAAQCLHGSEGPVETLAAQAVGMRSLRIVTGSDDLAKLATYLAQSSLAP